MDPNVALPLASSALSFVIFVLLIDQWRARRRPYQLIWAIGMLWYGISAGTEFLGGAFGWNPVLYRDTSGFLVGELVGVIFLFVGFLVSAAVFRDIRIPFTSHVLRSRPVEG